MENKNTGINKSNESITKKVDDRFSSESLLNAFILDSLKRKESEKNDK